MSSRYASPSEIATPDFAEKMATAEFGPVGPCWQPLGAVMERVISCPEKRHGPQARERRNRPRRRTRVAA